MRWGWVLLWLAGQVSADDGAMRGTGGSLELIDEHSSVRMVYEQVRMFVPDGRTECYFVFRNEGPATTVAVGFPEESFGDGARSGRSAFGYFDSLVDGRYVPTRLVEAANGAGRIKQWHVKTVHFAAGQTRTVVNRYRSGCSTDTSANRAMSYLYGTGRSWRGPIGRARFIVHLDLSQGWTYRVDPGFRRLRNNLHVLDLRNVEPDRKAGFSTKWWPGYLRIDVDGKPIPGITDAIYRPAVDWRYQSRSLTRRRNGHLEATAFAMAQWFGGEYVPQRHPSRYATAIVRGGRRVLIVDGAASIACNGRAIPLPYRVRSGGVRLVLPVEPVVRALGGSMRFNLRTERFEIRLPEVAGVREDQRSR